MFSPIAPIARLKQGDAQGTGLEEPQTDRAELRRRQEPVPDRKRCLRRQAHADVVIGVRADGQKVLLTIKSMGGESTEAWRAVLDDLIQRGLRRPEFLIVDGAPGLEKAIAAVWDGVPA